MIRESITDILKPKSREEVTNELDKISLDQKIDILERYYSDKGQLLVDLEECGADTNKIIEAILNKASKNELITMVSELLYNEKYAIELLIDTIEGTKCEGVFKEYIRAEVKESAEELNDIINILFIKNTKIFREDFSPLE